MNKTPTTKMAMIVRLHTDFASAEEQVTNALKAEGFGVLTEIDVKDTLKKKINVDFRPYKILGACNPALSYRALEIEPAVGLLLPCNVTLSQEAENEVEVAIMDPILMMSFVPDARIKTVAEEARQKLERVATSLQQG